MRDARCDARFASLGIEIRHGGPRALYAPEPDRIQMPVFESFESPDHYLATLAHESIHATGHKNRLDRLDRALDDKSRAREELVAEIGSASRQRPQLDCWAPGELQVTHLRCLGVYRFVLRCPGYKAQP